jgi:hypothetical protein
MAFAGWMVHLIQTVLDILFRHHHVEHKTMVSDQRVWNLVFQLVFLVSP